MVNLGRCVGSYLILDDLSNKVVLQMKQKVLTCMITGISESRTLTKHMSCKCECNFDGKKCYLN